MPRLQLTEPSIGSTTTRSGPPAPKARSPSSSETSSRSSLERVESRHDRLLGRCVDRRRVVATLARPQHGLPLEAAGQRDSASSTSATQSRANASQSTLTRDQRVKEQAGGELREEVSRLRRQHHATRARSNTSSIRVGRTRNAQSAPPSSTSPPPRASRSCTRCPRARRGRRARRRARPPAPWTSLAGPGAVEDGRRRA